MTAASNDDESRFGGKHGRPPKYKTEFAKQAEKLCKLGATDANLADFFDVSTRTIERWSVAHADFCRALKDGKAFADDRVERSLYNRAIGFEYDTVKVMQYEGDPVVIPYREKMPPDVTACIFWLKNRRRKEWRDKVDVQHGADNTFADLWRHLTAGENRPAFRNTTREPLTGDNS